MTKILTAKSLVAACLLVGACATPVPNSGTQGVGFDNYTDYAQQRAARDAELRRQAGPTGRTAPTISSETPAADTGAGEEPPAIVRATPENTTAEGPTANHARISDEQDFQAVSGRETIESDAERIAANRQQYEVIQPTALPSRTGGSGPNIVEFALATNNAVGQQVHRRSVVLAESRFNRNCAQYTSQDLAQEAFLRAGGPERDRMGLDPDGDGFACFWDPTPFRAARAAIGN